MTEPDPLALAVMVAYCGWDPTASVTATEILDGNGTALLTLPSLYVTAVTSVAVTDEYGSAFTYASTDVPASIGVGASVVVGWSENGCLIYNGSGGYWPVGSRNVVVTYASGYPGIPDDLAAALASVSKRTTSPVFGASSQRMGTAGVTFGPAIASGGLLMIEQMVFDRYRLPRSA